MSFFISVGIIFLAMLIQSLMQLMPGIFAIFYHSALGKTSRQKADDLSLSFILGVELFTALFFVVAYAIISLCATEPPFYEDTLPWIFIAIFFS
jgi:small-conductance mechanosensitive channel